MKEICCTTTTDLAAARLPAVYYRLRDKSAIRLGTTAAALNAQDQSI